MAGYARIGNKRNKNAKILPTETAVGVDKGTDLHNVFSGNIKVEPEDRNLACDRYERMVARDMAMRGIFYRAIMALVERVMNGENLVLMCWCYPRRCHAQYIKFLIDKEVAKRLGEASERAMQRWSMPSRRSSDCCKREGC